MQGTGAATTMSLTCAEQSAVRLMAFGVGVQAALGLWQREWYVDAAWVKSTWLGNDIVTLAVILPLLLVSLRLARRGSPHAATLCAGLIAFCTYNYAFYLFGSALNVFFPLYVALVLVSACLLGRILGRARPVAHRSDLRPAPRWIGLWLAFVGVGLGSVWLVVWARHVFLDEPTPVPVDAFRLVAALDLTVVTPALVTTGLLIWRRRPWGYVGGALTSIGGAAYLLVLAMNATLAAVGGNDAARMEAVLWGALTILMTGSAVAIGRHVAGPPEQEIAC